MNNLLLVTGGAAPEVLALLESSYWSVKKAHSDRDLCAAAWGTSRPCAFHACFMLDVITRMRQWGGGHLHAWRGGCDRFPLPCCIEDMSPDGPVVNAETWHAALSEVLGFTLRWCALCQAYTQLDPCEGCHAAFCEACDYVSCDELDRRLCIDCRKPCTGCGGCAECMPDEVES